MFGRITFEPAVMGGRACVRGMRMTVSLVVNLVANGMLTEDILREYPELEAEDICQALQYASALANEEISAFSRAPLCEVSGRHGRVNHDRASLACGAHDEKLPAPGARLARFLPVPLISPSRASAGQRRKPGRYPVPLSSCPPACLRPASA